LTRNIALLRKRIPLWKQNGQRKRKTDFVSFLSLFLLVIFF